MKIGISTAVLISNCEYWDKMNKFIELGFNNIELYNKLTRIRLTDVATLVEFKNNKEINLSFHSLTQDLFSDDKIISHGELNFLKAEIRLASLIGCKNLIFHINKKTRLSDYERKQLIDLANTANQSNIKLCLENNFSTGVFSTDYLIDIINEIDNLYCCLDIGHLNIALNKNLIKNLEKFVKSIREKIIQLHISFNNGKIDEHLNPTTNKQSSFFKGIINLFDKNDLLMIIETKNIEQAILTSQFLEKYV